MSIGAKHLAGFILGAAAGYAAARYIHMSEEEKKAFHEKWKRKANAFQQEAEDGFKKAESWARDMGEQAKSFADEAGKAVNEWFGKPRTS